MYEKMIGPRLQSIYFSVFTGNILCFMAGTALTWSSSEIPKLANITQNPWHSPITTEESSWISSLPLIGAAIGPFLFGFSADKIGRKPTLLYLGIPFFLGQVLLAFGRNVEIFYVGRFILGVGVGGVFAVLAIYIGEISEKANRGVLTTFMACFYCLGTLFSVSLGPFVSVELFNAVLSIPPLIFFILFFFLASESPWYLVLSKQQDLAKKALERLGRKPEELELEFAELLANMKQEEDDETSCFLDVFRSTALMKGLFITTSLLVFQQFSGINAVMFYSQDIFKESGTKLGPEYCTIIVMAVQFLGSFFTPLIADRFGRRTILIFSSLGIAFSEIPLGTYSILKHRHVEVDHFSSIPVITLTTFLFFFNVGLGPLPWTILAEIFPVKFKSFATAAVSTFIWLLAFVFTKYFEQAVSLFGLGVLFLFFGLCSMLAAAFSFFCVIETKGKTLVEIQDELKR